MPEFIQIPSSTLTETQTALEYYETSYRDVMQHSLNVLAAHRQVLFTPSADWFDTLTEAVNHALPPTASTDLLETAKWSVIDDYVPSDIKDSREQRFEATMKVLSDFIEAFAEAHHDATPTPHEQDRENASLDQWMNEE